MLVYEKRLKPDLKIDLSEETIQKVRQLDLKGANSALGCESAAIARDNTNWQLVVKDLPNCFKLYSNLLK